MGVVAGVQVFVCMLNFVKRIAMDGLTVGGAEEGKDCHFDNCSFHCCLCFVDILRKL